MQVRRCEIPDVCVLEPKVLADARGLFFESFNRRQLEASLDRPLAFVQDNHTRSIRGVLRGIHYQQPHAQAKLVRVIRGEIWDVAVDLRRGSLSFGRWVGETLSAENRRQVFVPEGFGHGFLVLSEEAEVLWKTTDYAHPESERCIRWDDPDLRIAWPLQGASPLLSAKDAAGLAFRAAPAY